MTRIVYSLRQFSCNGHCVFSERNECDIYYMETQQVAEIDTGCGLVLSPSFPSQVIDYQMPSMNQNLN